jgi:nitrogen fixation-related uncharacterized protein
MKKFMLILLTIIIVCVFLYGMFWLAKNGSYFLWYEDMVKDTIREMVKAEALKPGI